MRFFQLKNLKNSTIILTIISSSYLGITNIFSSLKPVQAGNDIPIEISQNITKKGKFITVKQEKQTTGEFKIVTENGKRYLELTPDFSTAKGPDVQIILHKNNQIGVNPKQNDYFNLAMLKSFQGSQRYLIPDHINLNDFKSVGIWCREFNVTFAYAPI